MKNGENLDYSSLRKAIRSLEAALIPAPRNDRERDGAIQRFEYTFELCWKFIRRYFLVLGNIDVAISPKPLLRQAAKDGLIDDIKLWFQFLEARNLTAHIYDNNAAKKVYRICKKFPSSAKQLLLVMQKKLQ